MKKSECDNHIPSKIGDIDSYVCRHCAEWVKKKKRANSKNKEIND